MNRSRLLTRRSDFAPPNQFAKPHDGPFVNVEGCVKLIESHDRCQGRFIGLDEIAGSTIRLLSRPSNGAEMRSVGEIRFRQFQRGSRGADVGFGLRQIAIRLVVRFLRSTTGLAKVLLALEVLLCRREVPLRLGRAVPARSNSAL